MQPHLVTSKLALVYPRQSSDHQVKENIYSLENQLLLKQRAIADGFPAENVVLIEDDLGVSGRTIAKRVGMSRALAMIDQGLVGAFYAEDQTRLSRDKDTVDHMTIAKKCRAAGVPLFYAGGWRDLADWGTRVAYKVEAVIGSEMWGLHMEKLHKAQKAKAMRGQATTTLPRGYRPHRDVPKKHPDRDRPLVYEPEAAVIRGLVAQLEAAGSVRQLFRQTRPVYWPDGSPLSFAMLQRILRHPILRGHYAWGGVIVPDSHEPIITAEQAAMIDRLLDLNRQTKRKPSRSSTECAGLVWCRKCQRKMHAVKGEKVSRYACTELVEGHSRPVVHFGLDSRAIDAFVRDAIFEKLAGGFLEAIIEQLERAELDRVVHMDTSETSRRALARKVEGLTRALSSPELGDEAMRIVIQELNETTTQIKTLDAAVRARPGTAVDREFYQRLRLDTELLASLPAIWDDAPIQWRRAFVRRFVEKITIEDLDGGRRAIAATFLDGTVRRFTATSPVPVTAAEVAIIKELAASPDLPEHGWLAWMQRELADRGFDRSRTAIARHYQRAMQ